MKTLFCWRCETEVPMFDEEEYKVILRLYGMGFRNLKVPRELRFEALMQHHEDLTGSRNTIPNAIMHHHISLYGPPCTHCGKLLRSPQANFCAACGNSAS